MWNSSALCRKAGLKHLISSASAYPSAKDVSEGLSLLFRRWATEIVDNSSKNLDPSKLESKMVTAGNSSKHLQGAQFHLYSYILASHQLEPGSMVMNCDLSKKNRGVFLKSLQNSSSNSQHNVGESDQSAAYRQGILDPNSQVGNCMPLADIRMGTWVHNIECHPGQGAKLARSAGTFAKVVKEPGSQCLLRLPSGVEKVVDSRCRATIGVASNPSHGTRKLKKAGENRWRGWRPVVRGVAMNPVDHPHGGGEGRTKGGRPSVSPWGKPTKAGYKTVIKKKSL